MFTRKILFLAVAMWMVASVAFAQSSGNFTYGTNANSVTACVLNNNGTGTISGGEPCSLASTAGACTTSTDCPSSTTCFNPSAGPGAGVCVSGTAGGSCTSDSNCTAPETCVIPNGATSGTC